MGSLYSGYAGVDVFWEFTVFEPSIVIHIREKDLQVAHFFVIIYVD
jgi:predicted acetyltransferase